MKRLLILLLASSSSLLLGCAGSLAANVMEAQKEKKAMEYLEIEKQKQYREQEIQLASDCESLFNNDFKQTSVPQLYAQLDNTLPSKDEFETWAAFEKRVTSSVEPYLGPHYVTVSVNTDYVKYDAENQTLNFGEKAFGETYLGNTFAVSVSSRFKQFTGHDKHTNRELVNGKALGLRVESKTTDAYSYTGTNALGATREVTSYQEESYGIFQELKIWDNGPHIWASIFSRNLERGSTPVVVIPLAVERARQIKESISAVIVIEPRSPYTLGHFDGHSATFDSPYSSFDTQKFVVGDMKCLAIVEGKNILHVQPTL